MTPNESFHILYDEMVNRGYADDDLSNAMHRTLQKEFGTTTPMQNNVLAFLFREQQCSGHGITSKFWLDVCVIARVTDYTEAEVRAAIRILVEKGLLVLSRYTRDDIGTPFRSLNVVFSNVVTRWA